MLHAARHLGEHAERGLGVGDDAEVGRIVAADLRRVGVDVDQPRRRNREREPRIPRARVRLRQPRADRDDEIGAAAGVVRDRQAPESGLAEQQRMILVQAALPHQRVRHRHVERVGERRELGGRARRQHAAAGVEHGSLGGGERLDDPARGRRIERRPRDRRRRLLERAGRDRPRRCPSARRPARARAARLRQMERALENPREVLDAIDAIHALAERPVDLELARVVVEVDLLMRMPSVEVRLHVAGDHDHRNRIERRVGHAGRRVRQSGPEMRQHDAGLAGGARVAIGGVRRGLLVPGRHEPDAALAERIEHPDDGVPAQAEHHLDAELLEVVGDLVRGDALPGGGGDACHGALVECAHGSGRTHRRVPLPTACPPAWAGSPRSRSCSA